jgi:phosphoserine phosphatase RsbU/P
VNENLISDLDTAPCGFIVFNDAGIIEKVNTTLALMLSYEVKEELSGKHFENILNVAGRIFYQTHFFPLIRLHGKANEIYFLLKSKNAENVPVICNAVRKESSSGEIRTHCILFAINERQKYEQELLQAKRNAESVRNANTELLTARKELEARSIDLDRQVSRLKKMNRDGAKFSKAISHDLQEPIRKIALFAEKILLAHGSEDPRATLEKIRNECSRLRVLALNLDKFVRLNFTSEKIQTLDMNVRAYKAATVFTGIKDADFEMEDFPAIDGYEAEIELLFTNLFENALLYRRENVTAKIRVESSVIQKNVFQNLPEKFNYVDYVQISISDNGTGFEETNPDKIFHLWKKSGEKAVGLGFGLTYCKRIVDNHFGFISVDSKKDEGSTITLLLPLSQLKEKFVIDHH